jgi:hypothetical protein
MTRDDYIAALKALGFQTGGYSFDLSGDVPDDGRPAALAVYKGEDGARRFIARLDEVFALGPVPRLAFRPVEPCGVQYAVTPDIEFRPAPPISTATLGLLLQGRCLEQLQELDLSGNPLDGEAVDLLVGCPYLSGLRVLRVGTTDHAAGSADTESIPLPAGISPAGRARLREHFGQRLVFADEKPAGPGAGPDTGRM